MKNGAVKHSDVLTDADFNGERKLVARLAALNTTIKARTLAECKAEPGHYIDFKGSIKGPFDTAQSAIEAHAEWMWESKHG